MLNEQREEQGEQLQKKGKSKEISNYQKTIQDLKKEVQDSERWWLDFATRLTDDKERLQNEKVVCEDEKSKINQAMKKYKKQSIRANDQIVKCLEDNQQMHSNMSDLATELEDSLKKSDFEFDSLKRHQIRLVETIALISDDPHSFRQINVGMFNELEESTNSRNTMKIIENLYVLDDNIQTALNMLNEQREEQGLVIDQLADLPELGIGGIFESIKCEFK